MSEKNILILGGYGKTGQVLARLLLQETNVRLTLAGRNLERATAVAAELNARFAGNRVNAVAVDAADSASLKQAFADTDFVLVASSTTQYAYEVIRAAVEAGIDYLDIQISAEKLAYLRAYADLVKSKGLCFISEAGFHPGLPAALVRYLAPNFDRLDRAIVGSVINLGTSLPESPGTMREFAEEFRHFRSEFFRDGRWVKAGNSLKDMPKIDFGSGYGSYRCAAMFLDELKLLPALYPSLRETGFYIGDTNLFATWVVYPLLMAGMALWPSRLAGPLSRLLYLTYKYIRTKPEGVTLKVEASGERNGQPHSETLQLSSPDGYLFTAIPVVAALLQYLDGPARRPGFWLMGELVEPERFVRDMARLGARLARSSSLVAPEPELLAR